MRAYWRFGEAALLLRRRIFRVARLRLGLSCLTKRSEVTRSGRRLIGRASVGLGNRDRNR